MCQALLTHFSPHQAHRNAQPSAPHRHLDATGRTPYKPTSHYNDAPLQASYPSPSSDESVCFVHFHPISS